MIRKGPASRDVNATADIVFRGGGVDFRESKFKKNSTPPPRVGSFLCQNVNKSVKFNELGRIFFTIFLNIREGGNLCNQLVHICNPVPFQTVQ